MNPHQPVTVVDRVFDSASGSFGVRLTLPDQGGTLPAGHRCRVAFPLEYSARRQEWGGRRGLAGVSRADGSGDFDELKIESQILARQGMVGIKRNGRIRETED